MIWGVVAAGVGFFTGFGGGFTIVDWAQSQLFWRRHHFWLETSLTERKGSGWHPEAGSAKGFWRIRRDGPENGGGELAGGIVCLVLATAAVIVPWWLS